MVAPLRSPALKLPPSATENISRIVESPTSQEPTEIEMSFMSLLQNQILSVLPLRPLCLCGESCFKPTHHGDTEHTKVAQRKACVFAKLFLRRLFPHTLLQDVLDLQRVWHTHQRSRTQS